MKVSSIFLNASIFNVCWASLVAQLVKSLPANTGGTRYVGLIPGSGRFLEKEMATHSSILSGKFHGQRSLAGYSPCVHRVGQN